MRKLKNVIKLINENGIGYLFRRVLSKIRRERISNFSYIKQLFSGKSGLEVGGPTWVFHGGNFIPIYTIVKKLDGCNNSNTSVWGDHLESGENYNYYKNRNGFQYILEGTNLSLIQNLKYEFVISSHCLEHIANPLKAIEEWIRVLKKGGVILLLLPHRDYCFDHNRPITKFSHLLEDYNNNIKEDDLTHLNEILALDDWKMHKEKGTFEEFRERSLKNFDNRSLHHHVFDIPVLKEIFSYFNLEVLLTYESQKYYDACHNIILGRKNFD